MVTIKNCEVRQNQVGEDFVVLALEGDLTFVCSNQTGKYYATVPKCTVSTTFTLEQAESFLGNQIPGRVEKVPCEEYSFVDKNTGEEISLSFRWEYLPEGATIPLRMVSSDMAA